MNILKRYITILTLLVCCCGVLSAASRRSFRHSQARDSVIAAANDSISLSPADSIYLDSLRQIFQPLGLWDPDSTLSIAVDSTCYYLYDSLAQFLPDTNDIKKAIRRIRKEYRDSVRINTPRILSTSVIPDSLYYERLLMWTTDNKFNNLTLQELDTTYNYHFNDYPHLKKDVDATYLGPIGSASQSMDYFKREKDELFPQYSLYQIYSYTPQTLPQFNVKTPYTELAYSGTLFSIKTMEESEVKLLTTQNINPHFNFTLSYRQYGSKGMLKNEETNSRSSHIAINYLGNRYVANAGYIGHKIIRNENGGLTDSFWIRDTTIDTKAIDVTLNSASNNLKKRTFFINHHLAVPMNFFRKNRDSLEVGDGTMAFIGHVGEFTTYSKIYQDQIGTTDKEGREFYFNNFFLNNTASRDSIALTTVDNKVFIRLQPFAPDAIISKIDAGIGYQLLSYYSFAPSFYLTGNKNKTYNNTYVYAGASGRFRRYFEWDADGRYTLTGYNIFDFDLGGRVRVSVYPFREGIHLSGSFRTSLKEPDPFSQNIYMNHHIWDNDFKKISDTRIEAKLEIPLINLKASFGYSIVDGLTYYDTLSVIRQLDKPINILSASLEENIRLWFIHLDNRVLFQMNSDNSVLPVPTLSLNLRYYFQFTVVKDAMDMQIGLNGIYNTRYYAQSYAPDLGVFYNQQKEKIGGIPYFDAFVNVLWKNVSVFAKYTNCFMGWPDSNYFSAYHYIRPGRGFKFGIFWPFYIK